MGSALRCVALHVWKAGRAVGPCGAVRECEALPPGAEHWARGQLVPSVVLGGRWCTALRGVVACGVWGMPWPRSDGRVAARQAPSK